MSYTPRRIDAVLRSWAAQADRKPLVLRGARQTGKTAAIRDLGRDFTLLIELNLERHADHRLIAACRSADDLLAALQARHNIARFPARTLLFFDEIQTSPELVGWLRYLHEDHPELAVIAAGSLMEVRMEEKGMSFPVGRVTFRYLHPFSFLEFLDASGRGVLAERLRQAAAAMEPPAAPLHTLAMDAFAAYLAVGGMPEAIVRWREAGSAVAARQVHGDLSQAMADDLRRYRGVRDLAHLEAAFDALPNHFGQRFKYESFAPGLPSHAMKTALARLEGAMVCRRVWPTSDVQAPLSVKSRAAPKLLPLDIGLALASMGVPLTAMLARPTDALPDGRVAEMVVGQLLVSAELYRENQIYFWVRETPQASAELDYLAPVRRGHLPIEVKAGASGSLKSLHQYLARVERRVGVRLYAGPWSDEQHRVKMPDGDLAYRLLSLPLYMAELVPELDL